VNDESLVVRIAHAGRTALFPGDVERAGEEALLQLGAEALRADVLKVPHHGSRTSSHPAFLEAVRPELAVIGCGWRNRYGHPHAETLRTLAGSGARVLRTDLDGTVSVRWSEGTPLRVSFSGVSPEEVLHQPTPQRVFDPAPELPAPVAAAPALVEAVPAWLQESAGAPSVALLPVAVPPAPAPRHAAATVGGHRTLPLASAYTRAAARERARAGARAPGASQELPALAPAAAGWSAAP
jgi:hypothetical protein